MRRFCLVGALLVTCSTVFGAEAVKWISVFVQPYYDAASSPEGRPRVAVGQKFDGLLSSSEKKDIVAARDLVQSDPKMITPMTLMVLAIRLYDVGLRDESVFWFYAAKERYITLSQVLDIESPKLAQVDDAVRNFAVLAGPTINGYAFCDIPKQQRLIRQALDWVERNPYQAVFLPELPAKPGDRSANLAAALKSERARADRERSELAVPANLQQFEKARADNEADVKFCWK